MKLSGKRALVTGAGTGIGRETALEFAREGADVVLHYSHDVPGVASAVSEIARLGRRVRAVPGRFERVEEAIGVARAALDFLGGLDLLVNNAGVTLPLPFSEVTPEHFDFVFGVNLRGPFFLTQTCAPALIAGGGAIVNIGSIHGQRGAAGHSVYAATKGAIDAYSRELAVELGLRGVRVNTIAPGSIVVEKCFAENPGYDPAARGREIPCGFVGTPLDVAKLAVFLSSADARYIVGQTLTLDGGTTAWMAFSDAFRRTDAR